MSIICQRSSRREPPMPPIVSLRLAKIPKTAPSAAMIPNEIAPCPTSPPIAKAANISAPRNREKAGMNQRLRVMGRCSVAVDMEDLLDWLVEVASQRDGQRQRGRVALLLDRVDRLPRDAHRLPELLLGEAACVAELADLVSHGVNGKLA